ncbi:MAG: hypothetical protein AAFX85_05420, partial [Pseudomonadota bacterium]
MSHSTKPLEQLVEHAGSFAQLMLGTFGEFYPFGCALTSEGEVLTVEAGEDDVTPISQNLIEQLRESVRATARDGADIAAMAVAYDARVQIRDRDIDSDAVVIEVDQAGEDPSIVFMLYQREGAG